jgi:hypothetical protein
LPLLKSQRAKSAAIFALMRVLLTLAGAALAFAPPSRPRTATHTRAIRPDDLPKTIVPEAEARAKRMAEVRKKMAELREYKSQGRRYDGERMDESELARAKASKQVEEAGFSEAMNEGEALFGGGGSILKELEDAAVKTTSGIGGSWAPPTEQETHKPTGSGSWGVFERPADISKAFGGGKRIGVGAPEANNVVNETKVRETAERLKRFREKNQADERVIDRYEGEIRNATRRAQLLVKRGDAYGAVRALEPIATKYCTAKTQRGADALLELALCHEANGDAAAAKKVYAALVLSPIADVKRRAKQLSFGFEAADKLSVGSYADSEAAKMARGAFELDLSATRRRVDNAYATGARVALSSATKAIKLESLQAVDETLRRAALGRAAFVSEKRCSDALKALAEGRFTGDDGSGTEPLASRLQGTWNVVMESDEYTKKYSPPSITVDVDRGVVERTLMFPLVGTVTWIGDLDRTLASEALKATRADVRPGLAAAFVEDAFDAELLRLVDDVCVVRTGTGGLLLLFKKK